jgi:zinc protease
MVEHRPARPVCHAVLALFLALAACAPATRAAEPAQASPAAPTQTSVERVASVEGITEYRLGNGLRVLLFPDASQSAITVNATYMVGARHEGYGETGMAHLLEHLLFKGTERHTNILEEIARRGGRANGTTSWDRTNYFQTFPPTSENLEWAIGMEADRMVNSRVAADDLATEMTVVRNEFEASENDPLGVTLFRTLATAYRTHGYGRPVIGARSDIEGVPIERLRAFYRKYYQPDNAVVIVAGDFREEHALDLVRTHFGAIRRPDRSREDMKLWPTYTREPAQEGERRVEVRRVGDVQLVLASFHVPAGSHAEFAAVDLLRHVLGNAPSGRLYQALVETGTAARVGIFAFPLAEPGFFLAFAQVRSEQDLDEAERVMVETIDALAHNPPTETEVERARAARIRDINLSLNDANRVGITLSESASLGDWRLLFVNRDRVEAVTTEEVGRVAATYFRPMNRTIGRFIPTAQPRRVAVPDVPDIDALVEGYAGREVVATAESFEPTPANIDARTTRVEIPGGARVALLPKAARGDAVHARIVLRLGDEASLLGRAVDGSFVGGMLMRGTNRLDRQALQDEIARLQSRVMVGGSATQAVVNIESTGQDFPAVLRLVGEILRDPAFDPREFETLRQERLVGLEGQRTEPGSLGSRALSRHLDPWPENHPRYTPTVDEDIERNRAATLDGARDFHARFYGTGESTTISVVGAFDTAEARAILADALGDWAPQRPFHRIASKYDEVVPRVITIETPDKENAFIFAGLGIEMRDDHPDFPALMFANYMLGGSLNSRLFNRIRQQEGLSYGVNSSLSAHPLDAAGQFSAFAIYAPQNRDRVQEIFLEEIHKALADGFTSAEIADAKEGWRQGREVSRATDRELIGTLNTGLYFDRTLDHDARLEARVLGLAGDEILAALRRHLDPDRLTIVRAGDFARAVSAGEPQP